VYPTKVSVSGIGNTDCHGRSVPREEDRIMMDQQPVSLDLEVEEIERREKAGGSCTSSTTSRHCTCACISTTIGAVEIES
jgi:hypothetical protein